MCNIWSTILRVQLFYFVYLLPDPGFYIIKSDISCSLMPVLYRKIYNVVDDDPAPRAEVFAFAQQLIERRWPGLIDPIDISINSELPHRAEKRVSNALVKRELDMKLLYPSYRSGLQSIINSMEVPI